MNIQRIILNLFFILLVIGCQTSNLKSPQIVTVDDLSLQSISKQNTQVNRAIALLEKGQSTHALKLINEVLAFNPQQKTALLLKNQLSLTPSDFFKTKSFSYYQVKSGDSLGAIAKNKLGNSLFFVSLAKFNNIKKPALLRPGKKIKIPLTSTNKTVLKEKQVSLTHLKLLDEHIKRKSFLEGLKRSFDNVMLPQHDNLLKQKQLLLLEGLALSASSISDKEIMINEVHQLNLKLVGKSQEKLLSDFLKEQQVQLLSKQAILLFNDKSYSDSAKKIIALKNVKLKIKINDDLSTIEKTLINKLHEQAIVFYRNHNLENALSHWQLIKQLQPNNMLASKYIQRTQKLLKKLNQY